MSSFNMDQERDRLRWMLRCVVYGTWCDTPPLNYIDLPPMDSPDLMGGAHRSSLPPPRPAYTHAAPRRTTDNIVSRLPVELLQVILHHLDIDDVMTLTRVSRGTRQHVLLYRPVLDELWNDFGPWITRYAVPLHPSFTARQMLIAQVWRVGTVHNFRAFMDDVLDSTHGPAFAAEMIQIAHTPSGPEPAARPFSRDLQRRLDRVRGPPSEG